MKSCEMNRLLAILLLTLVVGSGSVCHSAEKPNVLLILVDDLKPALGCYGDATVHSPNIDALAAKGMRFDRAYCNQAVCAPSRFTLMLGSHSTSTGLYGLGSHLRRVLPDAVTMPQYFAKHGYRTESLGKVFHIGHGNLGDPESFSVPHFKEKVIEYVDPASTPGGKLTREEAFFTNQQLSQVNSLPRGAAFESPDVDDESYADGRVAAETIRRLRAAKSRIDSNATPFFIAAGFARPHLPFSAPKKYWDMYDPSALPMPQFEELPDGAPKVAGKRGGEIRNYSPVPDKGDPATISNDLKRQLIHGYYASTSFVDAQIGKVIDELERLSLDDNTIVVLWGDHGFHLGDLGIWTKHTNYEQANRIPILISAPGVAQPGSSTNQPAESVDIFPTLAELAGLAAPEGHQPSDGVSLVPVLKDPAARVRDHAYHAYPNSKLGRSIRTERYRMVEWSDYGGSLESAEYELYDYETDPLETRNLAGELPGVVAELKSKLAKYPAPKIRSRSKRKKAASKSNAKKKPKAIQDGGEFPDSAFIEKKTDRKPGPVMDAETIRAGLATHDRALFIKSGWIRDPYITLGPDDCYYLTGTQPNEGDPREVQNPYNIGLGDESIVGNQVRAYRSKDLIEWESLGSIFSTKDTALPDYSGPNSDRIWAPELHWLGDRWALVHCPSPVASLALSEGKELRGPWTHPMGKTFGKRHDPSLFTDEDGTRYLLWTNTLLASLNDDLTEYTSEPVRLDPSGTRPGSKGKPISRIGHEGATMIKVGNKYVHLGTAWSTDQGRKGSYNLYYCVADKITGPYGPRKFAGRFLGHGTPFQTRDGKWWCTAFFNGNVPPESRVGIQNRDIGDDARTINEQGVTIVPLDVRMLDNGQVHVRAKDPAYANAGPDEAQKFSRKKPDPVVTAIDGRWSKERINAWYAKLPWLVGCNYYPATAINQIDMWQASTWDPQQIDKELGWAESIGMNTLRVYLHDLVWADDEEGLYERMDEFLAICQKHGIRPLFVFFDDCHYPNPKLGPQPLPVKAWHNSGWVNCPARPVAIRYANGNATPEEVAQLKGYVQGTMRRFADDERVLFWELYNEPGRGTGESGEMAGGGSKSSIRDASQRLVQDSWLWAREVAPSQPISSCTAGSLGVMNVAINRANSDLHSIHSYSSPAKMRQLIEDFQRDGRPVIMTEWLARTRDNTVAENLPLMKELGVGAINWGFVVGKSQTHYPWESRRRPDGKPANLKAKRNSGEVVRPGDPFPEPEVWFHDLFRMDGTPYDPAEIKLFRELTGNESTR